MYHRYVANESECLQYADDTTLYQACKAIQQQAFINSIEKDIHSISRWLNDTNLVFSSAKTKVMIISTTQMSNHHQLKEEKISVKCNIIPERVSQWKLLGITLDKKFLDKHISKLLKDCYSSLSMLKKLKRYTP